MLILTHTLTIILSFTLIFLLQSTSLGDYKIEGIIFLVIFYVILTYIRMKKKYIKLEKILNNSDIFILNTILVLVIIMTGNLYSPIFFLLFFLCFGISFIYEPFIVFIFTVCAVLTFLPYVFKNYAVGSYLKIGYIVLIAPLAYFFGKIYKEKVLKVKKTLKNQEKTNVKNLNDILEKIDELEEF